MVWFIPKLLILLVIRTLINIVHFFSLYIHVACWWAAALLLTRSMFSPVFAGFSSEKVWHEHVSHCNVVLRS